MSALDDHLARARRAAERRGIDRRLDSPAAPGVVDLCSNDYLGLARDPRVVAAAQEALTIWGASAAGSRVVCGTLPPHTQLDTALASLVGAPRALSVSSGYLANLAATGSLLSPGAPLILDAHAHASLVDGARLAGGQVLWAEHSDSDDVARLLAQHPTPGGLVVVESLYSALGDTAPLRELLAVCEHADATLLIDEAHGLGVLGDGRGGTWAAGLGTALAQGRVVLTGALGKASGAQGGFIAGTAPIIEHLVSSSRPVIFDTASAPATAAAAACAVALMAREPERVAALQHHAARLAQALGQPAPAGAIVSVPLVDAVAAQAARDLAERYRVRIGLFRPGATPDASFRLRITAHANLTEDELAQAEELLQALRAATLLRN